MPIHIIRDVALTIRSFYKRIADFLRYRQATRDMNGRYPDATSEEIAHEDVCIICRENMIPWQHQIISGPHHRDSTVANGAAPIVVDERLRPKKLPCGHILHFACLRSWLERQQSCPTCRRPVLHNAGIIIRTQEPAAANQHGRDQGHLNHPRLHAPDQGNGQQLIAAPNVFNLGPLRIAFGARQGPRAPTQELNGTPPAGRQGPTPTAGQVPRISSAFGPQSQSGLQNRPITSLNPINLPQQLAQIEQQLIREINGLRIQQNQLHLVRALQGELARLRMMQAHPETLLSGPPPPTARPRYSETLEQDTQTGQSFFTVPQQQRMGHSHPNLPTGMIIPPGWTVLPLQRLPDGIGAQSNPENSSQLHSQAMSPSAGPLPNNLNNTRSTSISNTEGSPGTSENGRAYDNAISHQTIEDFHSPSAPESVDSLLDHQRLSTIGSRIEQERDNNPANESSVGPRTPKSEISVHSERQSQGEFDLDEHSNAEVSSPHCSEPEEKGANLRSSPSGERVKGKAKAVSVQDSSEDGN